MSYSLGLGYDFGGGGGPGGRGLSPVGGGGSGGVSAPATGSMLGYPLAERDEIVRALRAAALLRRSLTGSRGYYGADRAKVVADAQALENTAAFAALLRPNASGMINSPALLVILNSMLAQRGAVAPLIDAQLTLSSTAHRAGPTLLQRMRTMQIDPVAVAAEVARLAAVKAAADKAAAEAAAAEAARRKRIADRVAAEKRAADAGAADLATRVRAADAAAQTAADAQVAAANAAATAAKAADSKAQADQTKAAVNDTKVAVEVEKAAAADTGKPASPDTTGSGTKEVPCHDGYYRDATGICVAQAGKSTEVTPPPPTEAQPDVTVPDTLVPPTPQELVPVPTDTAVPKGGLFGVPWMYVGIGGAVVVVGGYLLMREPPTPNRRRARRNKRRKVGSRAKRTSRGRR